MSQKLDADGNLVGPFTEEDLGRKSRRYRMLEYEDPWYITEMQVKVHVRPLIPDHEGPLTMQLAKERPLGTHEKVNSGESRSRALERDIEIGEAEIEASSRQ